MTKWPKNIVNPELVASMCLYIFFTHNLHNGCKPRKAVLLSSSTSDLWVVSPNGTAIHHCAVCAGVSSQLNPIFATHLSTLSSLARAALIKPSGKPWRNGWTIHSIHHQHGKPQARNINNIIHSSMNNCPLTLKKSASDATGMNNSSSIWKAMVDMTISVFPLTRSSESGLGVHKSRSNIHITNIVRCVSLDV
jgi:hypothetical protein